MTGYPSEFMEIHPFAITDLSQRFFGRAAVADAMHDVHSASSAVRLVKTGCDTF
jgi:hypothetical protein